MKRVWHSSAYQFIFVMGLVSLFADMTHEGGRSIFGDYLTLLGASAASIGFITGFGEFIGYSLRFLTGMLADRTKNYWAMTICGYAVNVLAIPLLALVPEYGWQLAAVLIVAERAGKAIRQPAKNTLISFAGTQEGVGKSFAIQEFMDQLGAVAGPVLLFVVMAAQQEESLFSRYGFCFAILLAPAVCCILCVLLARKFFPHPDRFEPADRESARFHYHSFFGIYMLAICFFAFGFIDFPLVTMHVAKMELLPTNALPLLYAGAMFVDACAALLFGWLYDCWGMKAILLSVVLSAPFAVFIFLAESWKSLFFGAALWGIGMGAQEATFKSAVSTMIPKRIRATGFGIFETGFGVAWFAGSCILGLLYDQSIPLMIAVSCGAQLLALPFLYYADRLMKQQHV